MRLVPHYMRGLYLFHLSISKGLLLRKAFNKVFPFNKVEVNEGLPSLERNGSKEGIESRVKPHGHRGEFSDLTETATDAGDDSEAESDISDVLSIFSTTNSLAPSDSSYGSMQAYHTNVAKQLVAELLKENELKSLYEVALAKFGKVRFAKNHDILLKELLIALGLGATGHQLQVVRILRGKYPRSRVITRIVGLLEPTNLARE
jgi:hypothetical protein